MRASWNALISAGRRVLGTGMDYRVEHLLLSGFLARAQGLHEGAVAAISADNPYAAFTLLRAYAENAAAILYVKDHPAQLEVLARYPWPRRADWENHQPCCEPVRWVQGHLLGAEQVRPPAGTLAASGSLLNQG